MRQSPLRRQPHTWAVLKERLQEEKRDANEQVSFSTKKL